MRKGYLMKRSMKKQAILLSTAMLLSMAGCKKNDTADTTPASQEATTDVVKASENGAEKDTTANETKADDETKATPSDNTTPAQEASGKKLTTDYTGVDLPDPSLYTANNALTDTKDKYMLTDESKSDASIEFTEGSANVTGDNKDSVLVTEESGTCVVTITKGGVYRISGSSENGRGYVDAGSDKVWLLLDGVDLTAEYAPIFVAQADKTILTLAKDSENKLADRAHEEPSDEDLAKVDGVVYSKDDLIINGSGTLTVKANYDKGIHGKDDLRLRGGKITVDAVGDAIQGNDSIEISAGNYTITTKKDGFVTKTSDKDGKGYLEVSGGTFNVTADGDGFTAATELTIEDGAFMITTGGGSKNGRTHTDNGFGGFGRGGRTTTTTDTTSAKGLKAETQLKISGGVFTIDSQDDSVHCDDTVLINGTPYMEISSGDDGVHAEENLTIDEYSYINILKSYEGYEAANVYIKGGWSRITASDDGINAAGGSQTNSQQRIDFTTEKTDYTADKDAQGGNGWGGFQRPEGPGGFGTMGGGNQLLEISGGYLFVNASGDGLDSNGKLNMTGGIAVVSGPTNNGNGPLDCGEGNTVSVTGGILLAAGSTGMMEVPAANYVATTKLSASAKTQVTIADEDGNVLVSFVTPKMAQGLVASVNGRSEGYKIYTGGTLTGTVNEDTVCIDGTISGGKEVAASDVSGFGGFGGFGGFSGQGGFPGSGGGSNRPGRDDQSGQNGQDMPGDFDPFKDFEGIDGIEDFKEFFKDFDGEIPDGFDVPEGFGEYKGSDWFNRNNGAEEPDKNYDKDSGSESKDGSKKVPKKDSNGETQDGTFTI